jgi:ATP-dependent DNA helicase RecQ
LSFAVENSRTKGLKGSLTDIDPELSEYLREWRRTTAKTQGIAAFIVMHDSSLDEICRKQPGSLEQLRAITGFGERKTEQYGRQILEALARFRSGARAAAPPEKKSKPVEEVLRLLADGQSLEQIAAIRGRQVSTIIQRVAGLVETRQVEFQQGCVEAANRALIEEACARLGLEWLKPIKEALPPEISYDEIRLVMALLRSKKEAKANTA